MSSFFQVSQSNHAKQSKANFKSHLIKLLLRDEVIILELVRGVLVKKLITLQFFLVKIFNLKSELFC